MLPKLNSLSFLEDVTEELGVDNSQSKLFKDTYKVFRVKDCPNILFKISSDWDGNWLAGHWYVDNRKITNPDDLLIHLSKSDIIILAYHLDILEEISAWDKPKFIHPSAGVLN
jgi:hypothetical protein